MATNTVKNYNRDPITGEPGSHLVGTSVGTATGAVAGAVVGAALGPIGSAAGVVIGTVIGGLAGAWAGGEIAEVVDPTAEEAYWRDNYSARPYVEKGASYDTYRPAYRYGYEARAQHGERGFDELDAPLSREWEGRKESSSLSWEQARPAVRDAYERTGAQYSQGGSSASGSSDGGTSSYNGGLGGSGSRQSNLPGGTTTKNEAL